MKPTLSECLRAIAEHENNEEMPNWRRALHEAADALDAASAKPESDAPKDRNRGHGPYLAWSQEKRGWVCCACGDVFPYEANVLGGTWARKCTGVERPTPAAPAAERNALAAKLAETQAALRTAEAARDAHYAKLAEAERELAMVRSNWDGTIDSLGQAAIERDEARAEAERLRQANHEWQDKYDALRAAPPTVAVTDVDAALAELGDYAASGASGHYGLRLLLRKHTREASVEEVAKAFHRGECDSEHSASEATGVPWENANQPLYRDGAREVLRALGVREAEKNATPFVVDRASLRAALIKAWHNGSGAFDAFDAETDAAITEYERQRAEHGKGGAA